VEERELRLKLNQLAKDLKLRTPEVQMLLCQERFLARLGSIPEGKAFIWKGGSLILRLYRAEGLPRYTVDLDLTVGGIPADTVSAIMEKAMRIHIDDGFVFTSITAQPMVRDLPYGGDRFELDWTFFSKQSARTLNIDACAGDVVIPNTVLSTEAFLLPLGTESVEFKVYPKEFVFAEKLETIVRFRTGNTRCKDFVDIWMLIQSGISKAALQKAITLCFTNRRTFFSIKTLRDILTDKLFQERLELYRKRHFSELTVPNMPTVMRDIVALVKTLDF